LDPHNRVSIEYVSSVIVWTSGGQTLNWRAKRWSYMHCH
jgi:hypothetical protein